MKATLATLTILSVYSLTTAQAQVTETTQKTQTTETAGGAVSESSSTTTTTTFNPEARTKVVEYFDTYKTNPHGLPPAWASKIQVQKVPEAWRTSRISPGVTVTEEQRSYLMEAPPELVKVLPPPRGEVRYYVAGSNVVAVNKEYKIVDSIQIPSIKFKIAE